MTDIYRRLYPLVKSFLILIILILTIGGLYFARMFLIPLAFALIFAMLLTPVSQYLEKKGLNRPAATLICISFLLILGLGLATLLSTQIAGFAQDYPALENQVKSQISEIEQYIRNNFGISAEKAVQRNSSGTGVGSIVYGFIDSFTTILANSLLTIVYLFMFMNYRKHFSTFILKVVSEKQKHKTKKIIKDSSRIAQQYLLGRGILIAILACMYSGGLMLIGVNHAILFSILAALVSIIPYFGNIIGVTFPLLMVVVQGGDWMMFLGVVVVFSLTQFIESYILEPYVVGAEVNIHPFFTIVTIIIGEFQG